MLRKIGFLKTTAIGGLLFLLPLIVVGALLGQAVPIVLAIADFLGRFLPTRSVGGVSILVVLAIACVVGLGFAAGVVARLSLGRRFSGWMERNLLVLFPRYAIVRDQMAGKVGGGFIEATLKPVLVTFDDHQALAFESDRTSELVAIFLPGAPDMWSGQFIMVPPERVAALDLEFWRANAMCKRLGRESAAELHAARRRA